MTITISMQACSSSTSSVPEIKGDQENDFQDPPRRDTQDKGVSKKRKREESDDEGPDSVSATQCPICLMSCKNAGNHRIVSLHCGHLFGERQEAGSLKKERYACPLQLNSSSYCSCIEKYFHVSSGSKGKTAPCPSCKYVSYCCSKKYI